MSLTGKAAANMLLKGSIHRLKVIYTDAYELAVKQGFEGTLDEWLASMKGKPGDPATDEQVAAAVEAYMEKHQVSATSPVSVVAITLLSSAWVGEDSPYSQVVAIDGITKYSKVDLLPSVEQLAIFHDKDLAFVTENEDGIVTVYAIGDKPTNDYTMQASITEVSV